MFFFLVKTNLTELQARKLRNLYELNKEPTCVGDRQPPSQEVECPIGGVSYIAGQRFKVGLSGQPAHKLSSV